MFLVGRDHYYDMLRVFSYRLNAYYRQAETDTLQHYLLSRLCAALKTLNVTTEGIVHCTGIHSIVEDCHEGSLTNYRPWHLMEVSGKHYTPAALPPGKNPFTH